MNLKQFIKEEVSKLHKVTLLEDKKAKIEKELKLINEEIHVNSYGIKTINKPIVGDALEVMSQNKKALKFTNKEEFNSFLDKQQYFSASQSHCYYSVEDLEASYKGEERFRDGSRGISEADRGCVMIFETGHELVAVWSQKDGVGYIVPGTREKRR